MSQLLADLDNASEVLRHQRMHVMRVGLRYVAEQSHLLADQDPNNYSYVSHGTLSRIERSQGQWFRTSVDTGILQALTKILWGGDYARFLRDTGLHLPLPLYEPRDQTGQAPSVSVPYHLEGETPSLYQRDRRLLDQPPIHVDFLFQQTSVHMLPILAPGQIVGCRRSSGAEPGQLVVLRLATGLTLAWCSGDQEFVTESRQQTYQLGEGEHVYGVVTHLQPHRPDVRELTQADYGGQLPQGLASALEEAAQHAEHVVALTVPCPRDLQEQLRSEARRLGLTQQKYLQVALEHLLERYQHALADLPDPLWRPRSSDPNLTTRVPVNLYAAIKSLKDAARNRADRRDKPTLAGMVLLAYRQILDVTGQKHAEGAMGHGNHPQGRSTKP